MGDVKRVALRTFEVQIGKRVIPLGRVPVDVQPAGGVVRVLLDFEKLGELTRAYAEEEGGKAIGRMLSKGAQYAADRMRKRG